MSEATDRLRGHVASYKSMSSHRLNCIEVCNEVDQLTADLQELDEVNSNLWEQITELKEPK